MKSKTLSVAGFSGFLAMFICGIALCGTTACDADVQTPLVTGLNSAAATAVSAIIESNPAEDISKAASAAVSAVINAAFLSITPDHAEDGTTTQ
jgi:hypothetical protein